MKPVCWVAETKLSATPCDGRLIRAHLIPKQRLRRELRAGRTRDELRAVMWDSRVWVWVCGGPMGNAGHHGQMDYAGVNRIKIVRAQLPPELEAYAQKYGLEWSLEADYGPREVLSNG